MYNKCKNKIGIDVEYSPEMEVDLKEIHNLNLKTIIENMYGTNCSIRKTVIKQCNDTYRSDFVLTTNDARDSSLEWSIIEK